MYLSITVKQVNNKKNKRYHIHLGAESYMTQVSLERPQHFFHLAAQKALIQ